MFLLSIFNLTFARFLSFYFEKTKDTVGSNTSICTSGRYIYLNMISMSLLEPEKKKDLYDEQHTTVTFCASLILLFANTNNIISINTDCQV